MWRRAAKCGGGPGGEPGRRRVPLTLALCPACGRQASREREHGGPDGEPAPGSPYVSTAWLGDSPFVKIVEEFDQFGLVGAYIHGDMFNRCVGLDHLSAR